MKLSEMRQIADKVKDKHFTVGQILTAEEWEFATMAAANFDKLLAVVEAARATLSFTDIGCGCDLQVNWICGPCALDKYLKQLGGEE